MDTLNLIQPNDPEPIPEDDSAEPEDAGVEHTATPEEVDEA